MHKQIISDKLEKSVIDCARGLLELLPNYISNENENLFEVARDRISAITSDAFTEAEYLCCRDFFSSWRHILTPWLKNGYDKLEYAYGTGFTWKQFLNYIIDDDCASVKIKKDCDIPSILFRDNNGVQQFRIELSIED